MAIPEQLDGEGAPTAEPREAFDWLVVAIGIAITLCLFILTRLFEDRLAHERLRGVAVDHHRAATRELFDQRLVLDPVAGLWATSRPVQPEDFQGFARNLLDDYAPMRSIEWVPALAADGRSDFEAAVRRRLPDFQLHERDPMGRPVPVQEREVYYPVLFVAPLSAAGALGIDRGAEPAQRVALEEAARTGQHQTSGPYRAPQTNRAAHTSERPEAPNSAPEDGEERSVMRTAVPVYRHPGVPPPERRGDELLGFVVGTFDYELFFDLTRVMLEERPVHVRVVQEVAGRADGRTVEPMGPESNLRGPPVVHLLDLGGQRWRFEYWRVDPLFGMAHLLSSLSLLFGLCLTSMLGLHLRSSRRRARELAGSNRGLTRLVMEREAAETQAREAQREFATLLSNLPGMAYRCLNEPDWPMDFLSDGCLDLTGYHPSEIRSGEVTYGELIHPGDRQRVWRQVQEAVERRRPFELVYRIEAKAGELRWVWEQGRGVFGPGDELEFLEGFITDITAQKRAEQGLRKEKHFSENAIDSLPGVFYLFDEDGRYLRWNTNLERVTGYSHEEIAHIHPLDLVAPEQREEVGQRIGEVFETGSSSVEASIFTKDGQRITYFFTGRRVTLDDRRCLLGMGVDVTDRVRAEEERRAIQRRVLETQRLESVGLLAGGIAHDFNNLLTSVIGNLGFARDRLPAGPEAARAHEFLDLATRAADKAGDLTQQLLAYAGRAGVERRPIDLSENIREIAHLLTTSIPKKVTLELQLNEGLPAVEADATQVQQVAMNLVLNGAESCGDRPGVVRVRTEARTLAEGELLDPIGEPLPAGRYVALVVDDSGAGMDEDTVARIFDPFFTTKFAGRGLGLAAVLGIVRAHGGGLEVRSSPGLGSSFEVLIPASSLPSARSPEPIPGDLRGSGLILLADDEPDVLAVARQALLDHGYDVITARDGREALETFGRRADEFDLVLLDMTMPEMSGAEALRGIQALRPLVPALLSSGYDEALATRDVVVSGLAGFLQKPYTPEALAAKVKLVLAGRVGSSGG